LCRGTDCEQIGWNGGERTSDGRFLYEWDDRGRLIKVIEKPLAPGLAIRRILYTYTGADRLVGRAAQYAIAFDASQLPAESEWKVEDRPAVLDSDRLPAETTFIWDPVTDNLIAAFRAGADAAMPHAGLLRQIHHGGYAYDDSIEVTVFVEGSVPERLYPLYDEAAGGNLQAILNASGKLKLRNVANDPYGAERIELAGPMVDRVTIGATKDSAGELTEVRVTIGFTEAIAESTVAAGVRLASLDEEGNVVRVAGGAPALAGANPFRIAWMMTAAEWQDLIAPETSGATPQSLSIAVTEDLRAVGWAADAPILPPSEWVMETHSISTSSTHPIELTEAVTALSSLMAATPHGTSAQAAPFELSTLVLTGTRRSANSAVPDPMMADFHAHPFVEPLATASYVRARWYHAEAGVFLSPDPAKYADSSDLYTFCAGDPIGCSDPTGEQAAMSEHDPWILLSRGLREDAAWCKQNPTHERCTTSANKWLARTFGDSASEVLAINTFAPGVPIVYVNGVKTQREVSKETGELLSEIMNSPVYAVWNPTDGFWPDILQTIFANKMNSLDATTRLTVDVLRENIHTHGAVMLVLHSQGAAVGSSALKFIPDEERSRIDVVSLGGAAYGFPSGVRSLRVISNIKDIVPWLAGYLGRSAVLDELPEELELVMFGGVPLFDVGSTHSVQTYLLLLKEELSRQSRARDMRGRRFSEDLNRLRSLPALGRP
ncbi:MAG: RHS repeat-associated core domain-containing protein, partial [Candidatus Binatia bacterium]